MFNLNFLNAHITLTHCALFNSQAFDNIKSKIAKLLFYSYRISVILKLKKKIWMYVLLKISMFEI